MLHDIFSIGNVVSIIIDFVFGDIEKIKVLVCVFSVSLQVRPLSHHNIIFDILGTCTVYNLPIGHFTAVC